MSIVHRSHRYIVALIALLLLPILSLSAKQHIVYGSLLGLQPSRHKTQTQALQQAIDSIRQRYSPADSVTLILTPGIYNLHYNEAGRQQLYISNHDQLTEPRPVGLHIEGMRNLTIEGNGSEFICHGRMLPIVIRRSSNIQIRNLSIDFSDPQIHQVTIVDNLGDEGIIFRPQHNRYYRAENGAYGGTGEGWQMVYPSGIAFAPNPLVQHQLLQEKQLRTGEGQRSEPFDLSLSEDKSKHMLYGSADLHVDTRGHQILEHGIHAPQWKNPKLVIGTVVTMRSYARPNPGVFVAECRDIRLSKMIVHYAEGMGLLAQGTHNISLDGFSVSLRGEGDPRYFTTQADATHFSGCSGTVDVRNGLFEGMMDDAINVHGVYLKLTERIDDYTVAGRYMHPQAWGFGWGKAGEEAQFIFSQTFDMHPTRYTIASLQPLDAFTEDGAKGFVIRFKQRLPKNINPESSIGIENATRNPKVNFVGNTIRNNRARGTLLNTSGDVLVERNLFDHVSGSAILVSTDCNMWYESGQTKHLTIRGNTIINPLTSLYQFTEAAISIYPIIPQLKNQKTPFYGGKGEYVVIENNLLKVFDTPLLFAISTQGIHWRNNAIIKSTDYLPQHHNQERFKLLGCQGAVIEEQPPLIRE